MKKTLLSLTFLLSISSLGAQELVWEKMHKESEGGLAEDLAVVNGKVWMSRQNELFVSTDDGLSWNYALTTGQQNFVNTYPVNHMFGGNKKIIVSGDSIFFGDQFSANGGATWETWIISKSTLPTFYFAPTVMHIHGKKLYLGTYYNGFFQSSDLGKTFTNMNGGFPSSYGYYESPRAVEFYNNEAVVATYSGLHRRVGSNWVHPAGNGLPTTIVNTATAKLVDRIRFLNSMWMVSTNYGVYYSNDFGNNWQRFNAIPQITGLSTWDLYSTPAVFYNLDVSNGKILVSYESEIYISSDSGATWKYSELPDRVETKRIISVGSALLAASTSGIYRSTDEGTTWQKSNKGFERQYYSGIFGNKGEGYLAAAGSGILKTSNSGKTLTPFNEGIDLLKSVTVNTVLDDQIFATRVKHYSYAGVTTRYDYSVYKSGSDTPEWTQLSNLPVQSVSLLQASANGSYALTGYKPTVGGNNDVGGIYITEDQGQIWKKVFTNITDSSTSYKDYVTSMLFEDDTIYVGTSISGAYKSWDQGNTWTPISNGLHLPNMADGLWWQDSTAIIDITTFKRFENNLYLIGENYLYYGYGIIHHSTDGGNHWIKKDFSSLGPNYLGVIASSLSISENGTLYVRLYSWDYLTSYLVTSHDNANTWELLSEEFPDGYIYSFDVIGDYLYAAGKTGLWRLNNPDSIDNTVVTTLPDEESRLDVSIYPNPFTDHITIKIPNPQNTKVRVEIFNTDGRRIFGREKSLQQGHNEFVLTVKEDIGTLTKPGIYFVRVTHGSKTVTRKIIKH